MSTETKFERRVTQISVMPAGKGILSEYATCVHISDEGAGEFVVVGREAESLHIDPHEWPAIRDAINEMVGMCRDVNAQPSGGGTDQ